ncbi:hypothetical protein ABZV31_03645 [Streptomyces sp. NPDC005202]
MDPADGVIDHPHDVPDLALAEGEPRWRPSLRARGLVTLAVTY